MTGRGAETIDKITAHAAEFSNTHPGITAEQRATGFTRMRGIFQDTSAAMKAGDVAGMLKRLGVDNDAATRLIQVAWSNLRVDAATTRYLPARAIQSYSLDPAAARQFAAGVDQMRAGAAADNAPFSNLVAVVGHADRIVDGGAMMFASMLDSVESAAAKGKNTIDFTRGHINALPQLKSRIAGMPNMEQLAMSGVAAPVVAASEVYAQWGAIEYPFRAAWNVAAKIAGLFEHHSPSREGPLREAIINFRLANELAGYMMPAPVACQAGTAAAIATAATAAAAGGPTIINLTYSPTINGASPGDWVKSARHHADELMRIIEDKLGRRRRLAFE